MKLKLEGVRLAHMTNNRHASIHKNLLAKPVLLIFQESKYQRKPTKIKVIVSSIKREINKKWLFKILTSFKNA